MLRNNLRVATRSLAANKLRSVLTALGIIIGVAAVIALVECYQDIGRTEEAIGLLQQLVEIDPNPALVLSLAELYYLTAAWQDLMDLAAGTKNTDDATLQIMIFQARALWQAGMKEPALEVYKGTLRSTKRSPDLLKEARYCRGALYHELGQKARAKADFAQVFAEDPQYEQVGEWLRALGSDQAGHAPVAPAAIPSVCHACHSSLHEGAKFCGECGASVSTSPASTRSTEGTERGDAARRAQLSALADCHLAEVAVDVDADRSHGCSSQLA